MVGALVVFILVFGIIWLISSGNFARRRLLRSGTHARGLILAASSTATETMSGGQRFEVRSLVLDVEIPGEEPYEVTVTPLIPRICEACPGAALDLRVDRKDRSNVTVIGPAGASEWIDAAPWLSTGGTPGAVPVAAGVGRFIGSTVPAGLLALVVLGAASGGHKEKEKPHSAPASHATTKSPSCESAERCCKVLGRAGCESIARQPEALCATRLTEEKSAAAKLGKHCP